MEEIHKKYFKETLDGNGLLEDIEIAFPNNFNFSYDVLDEIARKYPKKLALVWCDENGDERKITFEEMSKLSNKAANFFVSQGVKPGDFVMLILKRRFEYWYILNALHKIGAVAVPVTYMLTDDDLVYRINFAKIKSVVFVATSNVSEKISNVSKKCECLKNLFFVCGNFEEGINLSEEIESCSCDFLRVETDVNSPMLAYFTSGTTGNPKLVKHSFSYPLGHYVTAKYWQNVKENELHLTVSDTGWGKAAWGKIYGQWLMGAPVMVYDYDRFVVENLLSVIEKYEVRTFCAPPTIYRFFMKEGLNGHSLSCLKYATTAGESLDCEVIRQFKKKTGLQIMEGFGQTETTAILISQVGSGAKVGSLGRPSPMFEVRLVDCEGNFVEANKSGEICVKLKSEKIQVGLFLEYHGDEELNKFSRRGGFYHTGDIATCDEDGYFWYVGRMDDIIKSSGYRIGPFEVESVLMEHPAVLECGVVGVFDETRGQVVKAYIVLTSSFKPSESLGKELQEYVKKRTAPYKYPRLIEFCSELPKTISGKVRRKLLRLNV